MKSRTSVWIRHWQTSVEGQTVMFWHCGSDGLCCNYSTLPLQHKIKHKQYENKWAWLCSNENLFTEGWFWLGIHSLPIPSVEFEIGPEFWRHILNAKMNIISCVQIYLSINENGMITNTKYIHIQVNARLQCFQGTTIMQLGDVIWQ